LTLHTRNAGDQVILLRQDTRFLENGEIVEPSVLHPSMRIFVRAGRNLDNETEAFEVVWGEILTPK
jgi:hypothetical protein